jgi:hypothetical protein
MSYDAITGTMGFEDAIVSLKKGGKVQRLGWNGKGMWLSLVSGWMDTETFDGVERLPFIQMKTADGNLVPWLASQTDMLAEDWQEAVVPL